MKQSVDSKSAALRAGLLFGAVFGAMMGLQKHDAGAGLAVGALAGALFAAAVFALAKAAGETTALSPGGKDATFEPGEAVLFEGPANHFKGWEGVGGKLYLTDRRLRFRSHKLNVQVHDESLPLEDIVSATPVSTALVVPNGLSVALRDGRRERFVVYGRREWASAIERAVERRKEGRGAEAEGHAG